MRVPPTPDGISPRSAKNAAQRRYATVASTLFLLAAAVPAGVWYILFTVGVQEGKAISSNASEFLRFVFSESPQPNWPFLLLAYLPLAFLCLSVWQWTARKTHVPYARSVRLVAAMVSATALFAAWQAALLGVAALYYSRKSDA